MNIYYPMIKDTLGMFAFLGIELSVLFILISAGVSLLQQYVPDSKIQAILSSSKGRGYILAALLGSITPFCSCSTIPMLRGLLKAKAGFGPTLTFLFSSPLLNPIIVGLFMITFGLKATMVYACVALIVSIFAGVVLDKMGYERHIIPVDEAPIVFCCDAGVAPERKVDAIGISAHPAAACCLSAPNVEPAPSCCAPAPKLAPLACCAPVAPKKTDASCCASAPEATACCGSEGATNPETFSQKIKKSCADAWVQFTQVLPYLLLGISFGSLIYGFVPSEFIAKYAGGDSLLSVPIAAVIGIPLYVRVEALIPLSAVLVGKGMGLGAVMALIIGGAGASLTELILLKSMFRMPMMIAFLAVILGMAVTAGYLFQFIV